VAKVTVSFVTEDSNSSIIIESDPERNKDYTGKTKSKFRYGDTAYFRVYSHELENVSVVATDGVIVDLGIFNSDVTNEIVSFIGDQFVNTEKNIRSLTTFSWLGKTLGTVSIADPYSVKSSIVPSPADGLIAAASISYKTDFRLFGLTLAKRDLEEYPVIVYVRNSDV